ncbi:hypothetical protein FSP39_001482 [Pinctada imbricata]|uniref:Integrator complex subunit 6 n=1 Tax=Pinctada imbricata TaxID=66713 RepID=A0AA89C4F6_PINIB|nr:hypothetical protein FSP39_001482 [Pinctada imbricata]
MNQRSYLGTSLIDIAKASVETFMKIRSRAPDCRWDRYMLLTFEDPPANIKAGWKESHATFVNELKNLQAQGLTMMGPALKHAFDLLNVNRMQSGIDTYGQGRCPFYLEPAVIMVITDGGRLTTSAGVQPEINLPMNSVVPGSELTKEPFRWDQRIFGLVLRLPGNIPVDNLPNTFIPASEHPLDAMCEVTGGRSYEVYTQKMLNAAIDSLVQKVQSGVVISFEKMGPDPPPVVPETNIIDNNGNTKENQDINKPIKMETDEEKKAIQQQVANSPIAGWQSCRKLIFVPRSAQKGYSVGHWPIPESYWPDINCASLPPRSAQPVVRFYCTPCEPMVIENLPFDKYELEPSPLTQYILERREPNKCWQVFISGSAKYSDTGHPFGYLKASSGLTCVNLFMMPYNYPVLLPLLDELNKMQKPTPQWRQKFDAYLKTMPAYYAGPLRRALARMGAPMLVPDNMDNSLSYSVITYLKKLKNQAKIEMDRLIASVGQKVPLHEGIKVDSRTKTSILQRRDFNQLMQNFGGNLQSLKQELTDFNTFTVGVADRDIKPQYFRNPYDVPRKSLLDQIARMRTNFLQKNLHRTKLVDDDQLHSIPVQQMGNYQDYLKNKPAPLKELESTPARVHTFGNPFKVKMNMVDEADDIGQQHSKKRQSTEMMPSSPGPKRRKPGPLPKDFVFSRSPTPSPPASPAPSEPDAISINESWNNKMEEEEDQPLIIAENEPEEEKVSNHVGENNVNNNKDRTSPQTVIVNNVNSLESVRQKGLNNTKKDNYVWTHNTRLRHSVFKELKKPGRNYENLFNQLNTVQGTLETRCAFIKDIICEAQRFKKKVLTQMLEQFEKSMVQNERQRKNSIVSGYHSSR